VGILALCLSFFGFFSLLFGGHFLSGAFMVLMSTALIGGGKYISFHKPLFKKWIFLILFFIGVFGSIYDAYEYFSSAHMPGNYYGAWELLLPMNLISFFLLWQEWKASLDAR
jgi:hypothetical protein